MPLKTTLAILACLSLAACDQAAMAADASRPNIVFLLADDQRNDTLACAGHPIIQTPNIDRLAAGGVRFENMFVTTSVCWVSRAVILTGQWARSHAEPDRMPTVKAEALADLYPVRLREAGYRTAFYGKWHFRGPQGAAPAQFYDEQEVITRQPYLKPQSDGSTRHEAQLIADRAIEFLAKQDRSQPFCLNLWFNTAHAEDRDRRPGFHYQWPETVDGMYEDVKIPPARLSAPAIYESQPEFLKQSINRERFFWGYDTPEKFTINMRAYFRMISGLDHEIGRVLRALEENGLADNTIVVYSADNGYYMGDRGFQGKWSHYDQSLRVPLIIYDPRLPQSERGRVVKDMALNVDLPATFLDLAGAERPKAYQGRSLAPLVRGAAPADWRSDFFCEHLDLSPTLVWEGVRGQRYVYARYVHQQPAFEFLHDLENDPDQLTNLAGDTASAEALSDMRARCDKLRASLGPPIPPPGGLAEKKRAAAPPQEAANARDDTKRKAAKQPARARKTKAKRGETSDAAAQRQTSGDAAALVAAPSAAERRAAQQSRKQQQSGKPRKGTGEAIGANLATPVGQIKLAKDFQVELLYSVPNAEQGSWVNLCTDDRGRIIVSDQYGGLYRFPPPPPNQPLDPSLVEKVPADIRAVNGMVWAFGALYVAVNDYEDVMQDGLYRVTDSDGDDRLDKVELLRGMEAKNDHGVHALLLAPDEQSLYLVAGNGTQRVDFSASRVPLVWGEDHLLPRMPDGRGHMRGVLGPGGTIYRVSPDGKDFEIVSTGYRNIFDAAFDRHGELFTYDADMEYDFNTSWYRPTRVCHATSGSEFGWRNGAGKRPPFYPDNLPPVIDIGPGSPTGMTFGYGARFPAKYQNALFILDWSWGKVYAVHLEPRGASYAAVKEEFMTGAPLPVTDMIVHPADGAMYFTIGGRRVQSGVYRVTYVGSEPTAPVDDASSLTEEAELRHRLEAYHGHQDAGAVEAAWPHLDHSDRFVRWAARTAIEHQAHTAWADRALAEVEPSKQLEAILALVRAAGIDPFHRQEGDAPVDTALQGKILDALAKLDWDALTREQQILLVRNYQICFNRFGRPDEARVRRILAQLDGQFPAASFELNWLLCETLGYLQSPTVAAKALKLMERAATQEEQIEYARSLRMLTAGWTTETHTAYFRWFLKAANFTGGASFEKFLEFIRNDAIASLSDSEKAELAEVLAEQPVRKSAIESLAEVFKGRTPTPWTLDELSLAARNELHERNYENGRRMFGAAACFTCHRFANEGGMTGPDLTGAGGRYSPHDFIDQIVNPSKEINEQFAPVVVTTSEQLITGVIVNLNGDTVTINTDLTNPNQRVSVDRKEVVSIETSKISPMPTGLLNLLTKEEILDLTAYVLSRGDATHAMFKN